VVSHGSSLPIRARGTDCGASSWRLPRALMVETQSDDNELDEGCWRTRGGVSKRVRIRGETAEMNDQVRDHADRMVRFTMGRFAGAVKYVSLFLEESGKPWSGTLLRCRVSVGLVPRGHVTVRNKDGEASAAVDGALERAERAVQRRLLFVRHGSPPSDETNR